MAWPKWRASCTALPVSVAEAGRSEVVLSALTAAGAAAVVVVVPLLLLLLLLLLSPLA